MANNDIRNIQLDVAYHPGEDLDEKLQEMGMTVEEFARRSLVPADIVRSIIAGETSITADMAIAFEEVTGMPAVLWLNLQRNYDNYIITKKRASWAERLQQLSQRAAAAIL